ncbi:branched-chain amino acid ABC transporter permease [Bradyrhizobium tropiciagri]|uniref:branched-chain amino acid ABC transporter permease n=1 Tax=Bradyrhizobium tropiciagri TaxID=312253 RepID=UPI001BAA5944|nr:branched-chain amino acid ABC transporter permease [Bradyrhizobium tropiciagri]MBR0896704.1 branched-chain amino acid ABC transporter permease [Bradyrhizobium tropiciagri]
MRKPVVGVGLLAAGLAIFPLLSPSAFAYDLAIRVIINAIVVVGLNLLFGYTGQISLGHAGFIGLGTYASAVLTTHFSWPPVAALLAGAVGTGFLAFVIARPILSLRGHHLAMATLGMGIIIAIVLNNEMQYTGGSDGMPVPAFGIGSLILSGDRNWYGLVSLLVLIVVWGATNLVNSPAGRALQAIHGSEVAARVAGIDVTGVKIKVFVLSAVVASVMGSVEAHYLEFATPSSAGFVRSIILMTMVIVGGMASVAGSLVGAALLTLLPQALSQVEGGETIVFGSILILTMIFMPSGLIPTIRDRLVGGRL